MYKLILIHKPTKLGKKAKVDFFYSPSNTVTYEIASELQQVFLQLRDQIDFTPYISLFTLGVNEGFEDDSCIANGMYCAMDPGIFISLIQDGDEGPLTGADIVREGLFEKCIYKSSPSDWFYYMVMFKNNCWRNFKQSCSLSVLSKTNLASDKVLECIDSSFTTKTSNSILDKELSKYMKEQPSQVPSIYINGLIYDVNEKSN